MAVGMIKRNVRYVADSGFSATGPRNLLPSQPATDGVLAVRAWPGIPRYCSAGKFHIVFDAQNEGRCSSF